MNFVFRKIYIIPLLFASYFKGFHGLFIRTRRTVKIRIIPVCLRGIRPQKNRQKLRRAPERRFFC